jgi:hypothetical protein
MCVLIKQGTEVVTVENFTTDAKEGDLTLSFELPAKPDHPGVEIILHLLRPANIKLRSLVLEPVAYAERRTGVPACDIINWLPFLRTSAAGHIRGNAIEVSGGTSSPAIYGPYWSLPPGRYEMSAMATGMDQDAQGQSLLMAEVVAEEGRYVIATSTIPLGHRSDGRGTEIRLAFTLAAGLAASSRVIETRFRSIGGGFRLLTVTVRLIDFDAPTVLAEKEWLPYVHLGAAGRKTEDGIIAAGTTGIVGTIPLELAPGRYKVTIENEKLNNLPAGRILVTAGTRLLGSRSIKFTPRRVGPMRIQRGPYRSCSFEVPAGLSEGSRVVHVRIETDGTGAFAVRSITGAPKPMFEDLCDRTIAAIERIFRRGARHRSLQSVDDV